MCAFVFTQPHEGWVTTERTRSRVQAAEMGFLRRVAGVSLRDRVRSSAVREELGSEPLLLCLERSQLRWFGHLGKDVPLGASLGRFSRHDQWGGDLREDPGLGGEIISQHWPGNASGSPRQSWSMWFGKGKSGSSSAVCLSCCPRDPTPNKRMKMREKCKNKSLKETCERDTHGEKANHASFFCSRGPLLRSVISDWSFIVFSSRCPSHSLMPR